MRLKFITFLLLLSSITASFGAYAQAPTDTVYNPTILFSGLPKTYEIADIQVKGADNYEDYIIINYTGLKVGDIITIPSADITDASKRLWRQGLFSKVQITVDKVVGNKAYLTLNLRQQPRISEINYNGVKKGEKQDLDEALQLRKGNQITQNIVNRAEQIDRKSVV